MSTLFVAGFIPALCGQAIPPASSVRGPFAPACGVVYGRTRLASDSLGTFTLILKNAVVGSRYRIERVVGGSLATPTVVAEGLISSTTQIITLDLYAAGSANNDLLIKVRNASGSPAYRPFDTLATAQVGTVIAYISQQLDE